MRKMRKIIFAAALCVFLLSTGFLVYELLILPNQNRDAIESVQEVYYHAETSSEMTTEAVLPDAEGKQKENGYAALKKKNSDVIGWIKIPGTVVDYPVMQSSPQSPEYYLRRGYDKKYSKYGCIFLDARCTPPEETPNLTLYGHNMTDGQMFAAILQYTDLDFYKSAPVIDFDIEGKSGKWKVFSVFKINTLPEQGELFLYTQPAFEEESAYADFLEQAQSRSLLCLPVDVNTDDQILTLSTCSYEFEEFRTVVMARRVRDGEEPTVALDRAAYNPHPVYPDCWIQKYGT